MRWLMLSWIVACSSPSAPSKIANTTSPTSPDPQAFALHLVDVLEHDDLAGWKALVAKRADDDVLRTQLETWRRDLLPKAQSLKTAHFAFEHSGAQHYVVYTISGHEPEALAMVIEDHGALRIDDN